MGDTNPNLVADRSMADLGKLKPNLTVWIIHQEAN